jgi:hypothetical protein
MPPSDRSPKDITGLTDALHDAQVDVCQEIADAKATLKELRRAAKRGPNGEPGIEPTKADLFCAQMCYKTIQAAAILIKARPELVGKSAGKVSTGELLTPNEFGNSISQKNKDDKSVWLPPPIDWDDDANS